MSELALDNRIDYLVEREEEERTRAYIERSKSDNTKRAYRSDWADFEAFCERRGVKSLPASERTVGAYLVHLADSGLKASTINRRKCSIAMAHRAAGLTTPTGGMYVRTVLSGIRRTIGTKQDGKDPLLTTQIKMLLKHVDTDYIGIRDKAILLLGFAGAFRRSELVALKVSDLTFSPEGLIVDIRESKTDQEKEGRKIGVPYGEYKETCPVRAVKDWLLHSGVHGEEPLFHGFYRNGHKREGRLHPEMVAVIVKKYAKLAGLDWKNFAGHSLRSGMATTAAANGADELAIMRQTGHTSSEMVRRYIRDGRLFKNNAAARLGL